MLNLFNLLYHFRRVIILLFIGRVSEKNIVGENNE
jgi:hypothetical protein